VITVLYHQGGFLLQGDTKDKLMAFPIYTDLFCRYGISFRYSCDIIAVS
jgi:hypothetical protein